MMSSLYLVLLHICLISTWSLVFALEDSTSLKGSTPTTTASNQSTAIQHTKVTKSQTTRERLLYVTSGPEEDYYDDDDDDSAISLSPPVSVKACPFDRCEHLSPTCEEIQSKAGGNCLCPGIDGPNIKPDPPKLSQVLMADREVTVNWCSPSSTVHIYRVLYQGPDSQVEKGPDLNASYRSYSIANLLPATQYTVCVVAINNAGESPTDVEEDIESRMRGPCRILHTTASKMSRIYIGIGVGLAALAVVMVVLGILLCNRKRRKSRMDVEEKEMGASNHSYMAGSAN